MRVLQHDAGGERETTVSFGVAGLKTICFISKLHAVFVLS